MSDYQKAMAAIVLAATLMLSGRGYAMAEEVEQSDPFGWWMEAQECLDLTSAEPTLPAEPRPWLECHVERGMRWILIDQGARPTDKRFLLIPHYAKLIAQASDNYGVDADALVALAWHESSYRVDAVGKKGEQGLFQLHGQLKEGVDTLEESVDRGAKRLTLADRTCRSSAVIGWDEAFGHYRSNSCTAEYGRWTAWLLHRLKNAMDESELKIKGKVSYASDRQP